MLKSSDTSDFFKLFELYIEGILNQFEFFDLVSDMMHPNCDEHFKQLQTIVSVRDNNRRLNSSLLRPISEYDLK